jgi:probable HAF family extracellular repeat protein
MTSVFVTCTRRSVNVRLWTASWCITTISLLSAANAQSAKFTNLSPLDSGAYISSVSDDGSATAGQTGTENGHAFQWTASGGLTDLGTLGGATSLASGMSADGAVVVGWSDVGGRYRAIQHAFLWEQHVGMVDLGTLSPRNSININSQATGVSSNGAVVIGWSELEHGSEGSRHAFQWAQGQMIDLGVLGETPDSNIYYSYNSEAKGVSEYGDIVVGWSDVYWGNGRTRHAFQWTKAGGMVDLRTIGNIDYHYSMANAISRDGLTIVGRSETANGNAYHAVRWNSRGVITDLYTLGGLNSEAQGVNRDGSVIVGVSDVANGHQHAFRWTQLTGMQDLNVLLANAGVNMTSLTLGNAVAISADGQFITGQSGAGNPWLVRYWEGTPAVTTPSSIQESVNEIAEARSALLVQEHAAAGLLLGDSLPIVQQDGVSAEISSFISVGSLEGGTSGRVNYTREFSAVAGLAYQQASYDGVKIDSSPLASIKFQYAGRNSGGLQPFAAVGGWLAPQGTFSFLRDYDNGAGKAHGKFDVNGDLSYLFTRIGAVAVRGLDQIGLSGEIGWERLATCRFNELASIANPFEAHGESATDESAVGKLHVHATHTLSSKVDVTVWGTAAMVLQNSSDFSAVVSGFGTVYPNNIEKPVWLEYGARVGYKFQDNAIVDFMVNGASGESAGSQIHAGIQLRIRF